MIICLLWCKPIHVYLVIKGIHMEACELLETPKAQSTTACDVPRFEKDMRSILLIM